MNEQQLATWDRDKVILAFPDPGRYLEYNYRHQRIEETQPATHILRPNEDEVTLCGKDADQWLSFNIAAKDFVVEDWHPEDFEGLDQSDRPCKSCAKNMKRRVESGK
jgi:DICT domain-containing protein